MTEKSMFRGFEAEVRERSEAWAIERYGKWARLGMETRDEVMAGWTPDEREANRTEMIAIFDDFTAALKDGLAADGERMQGLVRRFHAHASKAWTGPIGRGGFINIAEFYAENPDIRAGLDLRAQGLADYIARAIRVFCVETQPWPGEAAGG
jgi:hypothetical protein